jgi:hypothetical protein
LFLRGSTGARPADEHAVDSMIREFASEFAAEATEFCGTDWGYISYSAKSATISLWCCG